MHELGIIFEVVKTVRKFAEENQLTKIETLVLQIGEISPIVPKYIEELVPPVQVPAAARPATKPLLFAQTPEQLLLARAHGLTPETPAAGGTSGTCIRGRPGRRSSAVACPARAPRSRRSAC